MEDFSSLKYVRTLSTGVILCEENVIVVIEHRGFTDMALIKLLSSETKLKIVQKNDIYEQYLATSEITCALKINVIRGASEGTIEKYSHLQNMNNYIFHETVSIYEEISRPYMLSQLFNIKWVLNILENKAEEGKIIYEDSRCVILPDLQWDEVNIKNMYLLVLPRILNIMSIRDLNGSHVDLLEHIKSCILSTVEKIYGLHGNKLRMFFHYFPSYFHLHLHVTNADIDKIDGSLVGRAHLLEDVIDNLKLDGDYYKKKVLLVAISENHLLGGKLVLM